MKWELHAHTAEGSLCGRVPAAKLAVRHAEAGYAGIVITDHFNTENLEHRPGNPRERVLSWLHGYEEARKAGEPLGLSVLFGVEVRLTEYSNEFLIYGAQPEFLLENPLLHQLPLSALRALAQRYNALTIQAHPNRLSYCFPVKPHEVDGYEVYNGNLRHDSHNDLSEALARETPALIHTSGSDYHQTDDLGLGSMDFSEEIRTSAQLADCLRRGAFTRMSCPAG